MEMYEEIVEQINELHEIISYHAGKMVMKGCRSGEVKNPYWHVRNKETSDEYYIMSCNDRVLTYISIESMEDVINFDYTWNYNKSLGYIFSNGIYLHAFIMDHIGHGKGGDSVDHINRKKLDNRLSNLIVVSCGENTHNIGKRDKKRGARPIPKELGITKTPVYTEYKQDKFSPKELRDKIKSGAITNIHNTSDEYLGRIYLLKRKYFVVENHFLQVPNEKGIRHWNSSKAKDVSIYEKYQSMIDYLISIGDIYYYNSMIPPKELHKEFFLYFEEDDFVKKKKELKEKTTPDYIYYDLVGTEIIEKNMDETFVYQEDDY